jgi:hypothetical protein
MRRTTSTAYGAAILALSLLVPFTSYGMDLSLNGFGSFYYGQALNRNLEPNGFSDTHANFTNFSLFGVNLAGHVNDDLGFAAQFVALGSPVGTTDSFGIMAQWASVTYRPSDGTAVHVGRQLYPNLMASEYLRVGFLLPYRAVPYLALGIAPFSRFDGVAIDQTVKTGIGKLNFGIFGGKPILDISSVLTQAAGLTFNFSDLVGAQASLDGDGWRIRAQASRFLSELSLGSPLPAAYFSGHTQEYSVGYRYDKNHLVSWSEYSFSQTPDGTPVNGGKYSGVGHGFYWLGGYRIGKFMPRYTFSQGVTQFNVLGANGYSNGQATSHVIGLNYQAGDQAVIKVEYERVLIPGTNSVSYLLNQKANSAATSAGALYAGLDFIF